MADYTQKIDSLAKNIQTLTYLTIMLIIAVGILFVKDYVNAPVRQEAVKAADAQPDTDTTTQVTAKQIKALFTKDQIYFGNKNSQNLIVMVSDPSCPYCQIAAGENPELNKEAGAQFLLEQDGGTYIAPLPKMRALVEEGKAALVWIYQNGHNNGEMATKALYCAYEQSKFWEAHDLLMSGAGYDLINNVVQNDQSKAGDLVSFLAEVVNSDKLQACLESGKYDAKITQDMALSASLGVSGTPGFFVNTTNFAGAYSWAEMESP